MKPKVKKRKTKLEIAVETLSKALKKDKELRHSYEANISMAFIETYRKYKITKGKSRLSNDDIKFISDVAADNFLNQFTGVLKFPAGR